MNEVKEILKLRQRFKYGCLSSFNEGCFEKKPCIICCKLDYPISLHIPIIGKWENHCTTIHNICQPCRDYIIWLERPWSCAQLALSRAEIPNGVQQMIKLYCYVRVGI